MYIHINRFSKYLEQKLIVLQIEKFSNVAKNFNTPNWITDMKKIERKSSARKHKLWITFSTHITDDIHKTFNQIADYTYFFQVLMEYLLS